MVPLVIATAVLVVTSCSLLRASNSGTSPLFEAVASRQVEEARRLVAGGADLDEKNGMAGMTALMEATGFDDEMVRFLIENGASVDLRDYLGRSALTFAIARSSPTAVEILLSAGASEMEPTAGDFNNRTPCEIARIELEQPRVAEATTEERQKVADLVCD